MRYLFVLAAFCFPSLVNAAGIGDLANNLLGPVYVASSFVSTASIAVGICLIFGAVLRYMQYRINPLAVHLSTIFLLFILGVVLVCLPLAYKLTESGIPFTFH